MTAAAPLRAFLVDDEPLALKRLSRMLTATGRVEIVGQATDPEKALPQIGAQPVDVLFLDIHMPGLNGFQVVERVPAGPLVVFTTAYDQHAVRAFEVNAIDYLLKPVERERLDRALDRVAQRRAEPAGADLRGALERLARDLRAVAVSRPRGLAHPRSRPAHPGRRCHPPAGPRPCDLRGDGRGRAHARHDAGRARAQTGSRALLPHPSGDPREPRVDRRAAGR